MGSKGLSTMNGQVRKYQVNTEDLLMKHQAIVYEVVKNSKDPRQSTTTDGKCSQQLVLMYRRERTRSSHMQFLRSPQTKQGQSVQPSGGPNYPTELLIGRRGNLEP